MENGSSSCEQGAEIMLLLFLLLPGMSGEPAVSFSCLSAYKTVFLLLSALGRSRMEKASLGECDSLQAALPPGLFSRAGNVTLCK